MSKRDKSEPVDYKLKTRVEHNRVSIGPNFSFSVQRTLRLPEDGKTYPLPPGLGNFPLRKINDPKWKDKVPGPMREFGGVFLPMHEREAAWINFSASYGDPLAVRVAAGKICAVTGDVWDEGLAKDPQNYMVAGGPDGQRWIDGFKTTDDKVSQFVGMTLGKGYTVEKQITGEETFGGLQVQAWGIKSDRRPKEREQLTGGSISKGMGSGVLRCCSTTQSFGSASLGSSLPAAPSMGLGAGGKMTQAIKKDTEFGLDAWDLDATGRIFIHMVTPEMWTYLTGEDVLHRPPTAKDYTSHGLPWFSTVGEDTGKDVKPTKVLKKVKTISEIDKKKDTTDQQDDTPVDVPDSKVHSIGKPVDSHEVSDSNF